MTQKDMTFILDSTDHKGMLKIMDDFGGNDTMCAGKNKQMEHVNVSVSRENIIVVTFQGNGWTRKNIYWRDGTREELFEGRWK